MTCHKCAEENKEAAVKLAIEDVVRRISAGEFDLLDQLSHDFAWALAAAGSPWATGCGDHDCVIQKPTGQGTNSGCHCPATKLRNYIRQSRCMAAQSSSGMTIELKSIDEEKPDHRTAAESLVERWEKQHMYTYEFQVQGPELARNGLISMIAEAMALNESKQLKHPEIIRQAVDNARSALADIAGARDLKTVSALKSRARTAYKELVETVDGTSLDEEDLP